MRGLRLGLLLAGTALTVVFAARSTPVYAATSSDKASVETLVPVRDTTPVPPPTAHDVAPAIPAEQPPAAAPAAPAAEPAAAQPAPAQPAVAQPAAAQPAAAPALAAIDQQVSDKLRDILPSKADRIIEHKSKAAVEAFYAARKFAPLWIDHGKASDRAKAVADFLAHVDADGLDPADYPLPQIKPDADAAALAEAELKYTQTVLTYARHAQIGRVHYSRISSDISFNLVPPEAADVLGGLVDAKDIASALERFEPQHAGYKALKAKLAGIRAAKNEPAAARIPLGPTLRLTKAGMKDPRVPLLRERLGVDGDSADTAYDKKVAEAVKKFQENHHLAATGQLNTATVEAINGPKHDHDVDIIKANMERWRWMPRDLGRAYVMVNIPDFTLKVMKNGAMVWKTKIVTGAPGAKATPLLSETMKYITVNPTWNVPPSIINNEYLPALQQDPTVLERMGLKMDRNRDGTVHIYQPPGAANALGRIRFNFPNKFLVYQHDTPDKYLFSRAVRDYSHGCMRVQDPDKYAEVLLSITNPGDGYSVERIRHMYGTGEIDIHMKTPIWVHLTYQTAFVDDDGKLQLRNDIYGRDAKYFAIMRSEEHKVADIPVEARNPTVVRAPRMPSNVASANGGGGGGLFGWLFGGNEPDHQSSRRQTTYRR
jgi:L,D-transpeptidase YcbB